MSSWQTGDTSSPPRVSHLLLLSPITCSFSFSLFLRLYSGCYFFRFNKTPLKWGEREKNKQRQASCAVIKCVWCQFIQCKLCEWWDAIWVGWPTGLYIRHRYYRPLSCLAAQQIITTGGRRERRVRIRGTRTAKWIPFHFVPSATILFMEQTILTIRTDHLRLVVTPTGHLSLGHSTRQWSSTLLWGNTIKNTGNGVHITSRKWQ